jgi:hypothetical protein
MARTPVTDEQFEIPENQVIHRPTGATWIARPGRPSAGMMCWAKCGEVLPSGEQFDCNEVEQAALRLLRARPLTPSLPLRHSVLKQLFSSVLKPSLSP